MPVVLPVVLPAVLHVIFVIHTEYPRFCLNVANDAIFWMEDFQKEDEKELEQMTPNLIEAALAFYDQEMESLDE